MWYNICDFRTDEPVWKGLVPLFLNGFKRIEIVMPLTKRDFVLFAKRIARRLLAPVLRHKNFQMRPDERSRSGLVSLIESLNCAGLTMVEIGSYRGESAEIFLGTGKVDRIYCVDPWLMFYDPDDGAAFTDMKKVEQDFDRRHSNDPRVVKVRGTIDTFIEQYKNDPDVFGKIDLVYIDGLHTYEGVSHDIERTQGEIKPLRAIAGHDYFKDGWPGIYRAVHEAVGEPDKVFGDGSWLKFVAK